MILLLFNCLINCQANDMSIVTLRGSEYEDTVKVFVDIKSIKSANIKMIERKYLLEELVVKDSIIFSYKNLLDVQNKEIKDYEKNYKKIYNYNEQLLNKNIEINKDVKLYKTTSVVFGSLSFALTLTLILFLIIK